MYHFDRYGWFTSDNIPGQSTQTAPPTTSETTTVGELRPNWTGYAWRELPYFEPQPDPQPQPEVPAVVSRFQARAALHLAGLLESVEAMMAAPETGAIAKLAWADAQEFKRESPTIAALSASLGLSDSQLDELFIAAAQIDA